MEPWGPFLVEVNMRSDKGFFICFMAVGLVLIAVLESTVDLGLVLIAVLESTVDLGRYDGKVAGAIIMGVLTIRAVVGTRRR